MTARVVNGFNAIGLRNSEPRKRVGSEYIIRVGGMTAVLE
jgi:hypothetical protein